MRKRKSTSKQSNNDSPDKQAKAENKDFKEWGMDKVSEFLSKFDLAFAIQPFNEHKINGAVLEDLTAEHLEKMGITPVGDQLRILSAINDVTDRPIAVASPLVEQEGKVFNDPIHGHISMHPLCIRIMDTPQFQRLRYLRQLGGCYYVFPGASHNRFEHSIGVGHLAKELTVTLQRKQPELNITEQDVLCVQIAGLCHDLGHGPFSHMYDSRFIPKVRPGCTWQHEQASVMMFNHLVQENNLVPEFEKYGLKDKDRVFITEQIAGPRKSADNKSTYEGRDKNKYFLYEIVANKRNGIDVDKWDYFARDCYHLGIRNNFDHNRFMTFARVLDVEDELQICSRDKEVGSLYDMFQARMSLHRRAYQHKTCSLIELMITEAMIAANDHIKIPGKDGVMRKMSECIEDMEAYTRLTDHIFQQILYSTEPALQPARDILHKVECRQLYKCIGQSRPKQNKKLQQNELETLMQQIVGDQKVVTKDMLYLQLVSFDYGMKSENPIDHVRFYMKSDPTRGMQIRRDDASKLLPSTFYEQYVRLYCRSLEPEHLAAAKNCFTSWCNTQDFISSTTGGDLMSAELTPLKPSGSQNSSSTGRQNSEARARLF